MKPIQYNNTTYYLSTGENLHHLHLCIEGDYAGFEGKVQGKIFKCPVTPENAAALRERLPWLKPQPLGLATSFGFGDRLGLATSGHIMAVQGKAISPVFAQQSVRENTRTRRTPRSVLDDAMWAVFKADWRLPWGADADHIKEISDLPPFIEAGYSFYTIDPNQYVDNAAQDDRETVLRTKVSKLPWEGLGLSWDNLRQFYLNTPFQLDGMTLVFQERDLLRAAAKYGRAIAHIKTISDYLNANIEHFDLEASVDETDTPTSVQEHYFLASELRRLGVPFVSLAPRFIGSFEKGVDYIGDLVEFDRELSNHAAVMHAIGGYKLSIHTGSDKFSIYPSIAREARNLVHIKTAGTSYLEALRVVATVDKPFFRKILDLARARYESDKATYHLSGNLDKVPASQALKDTELLKLFEQFDSRQALHVTFGSILDEFGEHLRQILNTEMGLYNQFLKLHFERHLEPYVS